MVESRGQLAPVGDPGEPIEARAPAPAGDARALVAASTRDTRGITGHEAGFEHIFAVHYLPLVRLATLMVGSEAIAEELVQDAFARVHRKLTTIVNPGGYLRVAVVNACRNEFRRRAAARRAPLVRLEPVIDQHDELLDVLAQLPRRQQIALVLRFYEQATEAEIAEALGCRPGTVKSLIHRGLARVKQELRDE